MYNFSHILYSHSDYDNVWEVWKHQLDKYLPNSRVHMFVDEFSLQETYPYNIVLYQDSLQYTDRVISCLDKLTDDEEVVIYQHEDMFLYDMPDITTLNQLAELVRIEDVDLIRLVRVVNPLIKFNKHPLLYENPTNDKYSTQPTLLKVKTLKKIFSQSPNRNVWDFEKHCSSTCNDMRSYFCYSNENKRGLIHYNSETYPYIATAVCKGQWNMEEYPNELTKIFYEMGI